MSTLHLRHHTDPEPIREVLLAIYAEVYADVLHEPFNSRDRFAQRLDSHVAGLRWEAISSDRPAPDAPLLDVMIRDLS